MAMRAARNRRKAGDDHVRAKFTNDAHDIRQHFLLVPNVECLAIVLGKAEVNGARKKLPAAINPPGRTTG
jgi:hypothetical protein